MHEDLFERRLRGALHDEGDSLPFTITADELRRRQVARRRPVRRPGLLFLAAAVGVGLVGIGVVAGRWLDRSDESPRPFPSTPIVAQASQTTPVPSSLVLPVSLPPLEAFLAPFDPGEIVRAQAVGPATAPTFWSREIGGPGSTTFASVTSPGSYRVWLACLGADVTLNAVRAKAGAPADSIPVACDGNTTARDLGLAAGDSLSISTTAPTSWRIALVDPGRTAPHAKSIAKDVTAAAGRRLDAEAASENATPDYGATGSPSVGANAVMSLSFKDAFRIAVSCAGPVPLRYRLAAPIGSTIADDRWAATNIAMTVQCDGGTHVDELRFPFSTGADVWIEDPAGSAWRIAAAWEDPPIASAPDGDGWGLGIGLGPNLWLVPTDPDVAEMSFEEANRVRLYVTCLGGTSVDLELRDLDTNALTTGTALCRDGSATDTIIPVDEPGRRFALRTAIHGPMWLAVTLQQGTPVPSSG